MRTARRSATRVASASMALALSVGGGPAALAQDDADPGPRPATSLLDLSGLAVIGEDQLVAVHDAKNPDEDERPRASLLTLTRSPEGVTWQPIAFVWPADLGPPNDLESASAIPGSTIIVLAESGDDGGDAVAGFQRLFFAQLEAATDAPESGPSATLVGVVAWPERATNVEGMAVARVGDALVLLYAERAQGRATTRIRWASLTLDPPHIGEPASVRYRSPAVRGPDDRPVSAIEVGPDGTIYVASAFDSGDDDGPFSSSVWVAGRLTMGEAGPEVDLRRRPRLVGTLDGLKVESLAYVPAADGTGGLFVGTDDEDYGGILRPLR